MKKIQNPERWVGKKIPRNMEYDHLWRDYDKCDDCQCLWYATDTNGHAGLHSLLYPISDADWKLQKQLHVEEAQSFCPICLEQIEKEADVIDPEWRKRHGYE